MNYSTWRRVVPVHKIHWCPVVTIDGENWQNERDCWDNSSKIIKDAFRPRSVGEISLHW